MVNDHVGPKGNRLKVWESPSGHHLPEKRLHGLEEADWSDMSSKSSQVRCRDDPHLADLAFRKLFIGKRD